MDSDIAPIGGPLLESEKRVMGSVSYEQTLRNEKILKLMNTSAVFRKRLASPF